MSNAVTLTCPKCKSRFSALKKIAPAISEPVDIDLLMYTCPYCHYRFFQNPRTKYQSVECVVDGITFQSRLEGRRYPQLKLMEQSGEIHDLQLQPEFLIQEAVKDPYTHKKLKPIYYTGDFIYVDSKGQKIAEEIKGYMTELFRVKWKLVIPRYPKIKFMLLHGEDF
jgi:predicted nucleic-acid-binding Zn-ribbon protein